MDSRKCTRCGARGGRSSENRKSLKKESHRAVARPRTRAQVCMFKFQSVASSIYNTLGDAQSRAKTPGPACGPAATGRAANCCRRRTRHRSCGTSGPSYTGSRCRSGCTALSPRRVRCSARRRTPAVARGSLIAAEKPTSLRGRGDGRCVRAGAVATPRAKLQHSRARRTGCAFTLPTGPVVGPVDVGMKALSWPGNGTTAKSMLPCGHSLWRRTRSGRPAPSTAV